MGLNVFVFSGNLGRDAEQRFTAGGDSIVTLSVPVTSGFGDKQKTAWVRCSLFGKRGDSVLPYLKKGQLVGVTGEFSMNEWTNKEGIKQSTPEVRVNDLQLLGKASGERPASDGEYQPAPKADRNAQGAPRSNFDDLDDDIPFAPIGKGRLCNII